MEKQSTAEYRGVRPRARLTGRAGGLERLDLGPIWAAPKWSRDTSFLPRRPRALQVHCTQRPNRANANTCTHPRTSHGFHGCIQNRLPPCLAWKQAEGRPLKNGSATSFLRSTWIDFVRVVVLFYFPMAPTELNNQIVIGLSHKPRDSDVAFTFSFLFFYG